MKGGEAMCCHTGSQQGMYRWGPQNACLCGCDEPFDFRPRFMTKTQRIARLEKHLDNLRNEAQAVEEEIDRIQKLK